MVRRYRIADRVQDICTRVNFDSVNVTRRYIVLRDKFEHQVDGWVREHAAWIGFDRHAGVDNSPDFAEALRGLSQADTAALHGIKAPRAVQRIGIGGETAHS